MNGRRLHQVRLARGFTLIELLAVMMVLSLVAAIVAPSLSRSDREGALQAAIWEYLTVDAQARFAAQTSGRRSVVRVCREGTRVRADLIGGEQTPVVVRDLHRSVHLRLANPWNSGADAVSALVIDRRGQSVDARVDIWVSDRAMRSWTVHGLTGQFIRVNPHVERAR